MAQNLYVTGAEQGSGKSVIVLAMMETLSGHGGRLGFFRPVVHPETPDHLIQLVGGPLPGSSATTRICTAAPATQPAL